MYHIIMMRKLLSPILGLCALTLGSASISAQTSAPEPILPIPTQAQIDWQRLETYAFIHFGLNTFNDLEWGYGNTPAKTFAPPILDVEQWVTTLKRAGMKGIILTAKHHDGFCLWPTKTTEYSVKNSPWKAGKGDLVKDLSEACHRHGLLFGIYLSPWDRNNAQYGFPEYQKTFHEQIRELTTNYGKLFEYWFDGANGGTGWYGGADSARKIDPLTYYDYEGATKMLLKNNKDIMIFGGTTHTIRWIGNERGWAGETNWAMYDESKQKHYTQAQWGMETADKWCPGEVDVSIRPGWFYHHREDHQVRSVANLVNIYYESVGRNANLLLNCPINLEGKISATDSARLIAWHDHLQKAFRHNKLRKASVHANDSRTGKTFRTCHINDGNPNTYWAAKDGTTTATLTFTLPKEELINNIALQEHIALGQRVRSFRLEVAGSKGDFRPIETRDSLTTIGYKRLIRFSAVHAKQLRLTVTDARGPVCLSEVAAYLAPEVLEAPTVRRDSRDSVYITTTAANARLEYALIPTEGNKQQVTWRPYQGALYLPGDHFTLKARVSTAANSDRPETTYEAGYSLARVQMPGLSEAERTHLFDGNGYTQVVLPKGMRSVTLELGETKGIHRLVYTPSQLRDVRGHIQRYELYIDGHKVAEGEFSNIKHNPIPVAIELGKEVQGKMLRLVVTKTVDDAVEIVLGDLSIN
jgi:hypothetical protein